MSEEQKYAIQGLDEYIRLGEPQQRERSEAWKGDHLSQILTYVMNQENDAQPHTKDTRGILVYPTIDTELDVSYVYKNTNHVIRVSTVNLNQDWRMIEQRLKEIICN